MLNGEDFTFLSSAVLTSFFLSLSTSCPGVSPSCFSTFVTAWRTLGSRHRYRSLLQRTGGPLDLTEAKSGKPRCSAPSWSPFSRVANKSKFWGIPGSSLKGMLRSSIDSELGHQFGWLKSGPCERKARVPYSEGRWAGDLRWLLAGWRRAVKRKSSQGASPNGSTSIPAVTSPNPARLFCAIGTHASWFDQSMSREVAAVAAQRPRQSCPLPAKKSSTVSPGLEWTRTRPL